MNRKILVLFILCMMIGVITSCGGGNESATSNAGSLKNEDNNLKEDIIPEKSEEDIIKDVVKNINVGDSYIFGSYEQDNDNTNGKEDIEWEVVAKTDTSIFLVSKKIVDGKKYDSKRQSVWSECEIRSWLNNEFFTNAFSIDEQSLVIETKVLYGSTIDTYTIDKIFLINLDELEEYYKTKESRMKTPTDYAVAQGVWKDSKGLKATDCGNWWLRCRWSKNYDKATDVVVQNGELIAEYTDETMIGVVPALWITPKH